MLLHLCLVSGYGGNVTLSIAMAQAVAAGVIAWPLLGPWAAVLSGALIAGVAVGAWHSAETGLLVAAGLGHAVLYGALLAWFGSSLRPGRIAVLTRLAQRINPHFHPGMVPYTRKVTLVWCLFAAGQLLLSAALLLWAPLSWWLLLVGTLHAPMALGLAVIEFAVRARRFPGQHTSFSAMVRGLRAGPAAAGTSRSAADCPARIGNATRPPRAAADSAPGPAA